MLAGLGLPVQLQDQDIAFSFWTKDSEEEDFAVLSFVVEETIFGLPRIEIMLISSNPAVKLDALLDNPATLTVHHKYLPQLRHFSGVVVEAERGNEGHHKTQYRVTLLPSLYRLDNGSDCRIFQNQSVQEIIATILQEHEIENVTWQIDEEHAQREYLVAYNETHLAFIERIMAEEGFFYYFVHEKEGQLKLVITDQPLTIPECAGQKTLEYNAMASGAIKEPYCFSMHQRRRLRATRFAQRDYTFHNPNIALEQTGNANDQAEKGKYALYRYPGRYKKNAVGQQFTQTRLDALRVDSNLIEGEANTPLLVAGHQFALTDHPDNTLNNKWRILTIRHEGTQPQAWGEDAQGPINKRPTITPPAIPGSDMSASAFGIARSSSAGLLETRFKRGLDLAANGAENAQNAATYACAFTATDYRLPYRAPQSRKPLIDGPQIAIVVGPEGEEIYTDEHGRVKVHFPWDRHHAPTAEDSSCWVRVSSSWAGATWGNISIPRVGHEVVVEYLDGDPDQPIITGRTYHNNNKSPYPLPDNKTKMVIRSDTHKNEKGKIGFNEMSFEDEKGQEKIYIHAQKDQEIHVKNNSATRVDKNKTESIGNSVYTEIAKDNHQFIGGDYTLYIGSLEAECRASVPSPDLDPSILTVANSMDVDTSLGRRGHFRVMVSKDFETQTSGIYNLRASGSISFNTGESFTTSVTGDKFVQVQHNSFEHIRKCKMIYVKEKFEIRCGKSKFIMAQDGSIDIIGNIVKISGSKIKLN